MAESNKHLSHKCCAAALCSNFIVYCLLFISKVNKIQNMMYHCSQLAKAIRGEQWLDALN